MTKEVIERIYSGWLGKVIGVRLGSPTEGMWYNRIKETYGEITDYVADYDLYAADDDTNGPMFFLRGLSDGGNGRNMTARDVGNALLNYAPYEHGFFWWGGYGISTEHTAYLNLRAGVPAGRSGSAELNGTTVAEQIGGQIFIDTWGLVAPGDPDLAVRLAEKAASVTHGGNGVYGGIFVAACVSCAFAEKDVKKLIEKGLSYIPADCEYARVVKAVMNYHGEHPDDWRGCYTFVRDNFGYDKYPGNCHIIPNAAVVVLSLLYGEGDFSRSVCISNMCGWDTDCNAGNVGAIAGVVAGLDGIDEKWIKPINDLMISSSTVGSLNISDLPSNALYIARLAAELQGEKLPSPYRETAEKAPDSCHFEFPRSTHAINVLRRKRGEELSFAKKRYTEGEKKPKPGYTLENTGKTARSGGRSLRIKVTSPHEGEEIYVFKRTYYHPSDFTDSRYDPSFSPTVYPGQTVAASAYLPAGAQSADATLFYFDERHGKAGYGEKVTLSPGEWKDLTLKIPRIKAGLITAVGLCFTVSR
ncbi:MAG: ADP-ribosylglycohydrolase family protein, partial [Clostridia bacterium]|nr:ADP-ribosylglycohydrolase family protein [Clostridia bacterium]